MSIKNSETLTFFNFYQVWRWQFTTLSPKFKHFFAIPRKDCTWDRSHRTGLHQNTLIQSKHCKKFYIFFPRVLFAAFFYPFSNLYYLQFINCETVLLLVSISVYQSLSSIFFHQSHQELFSSYLWHPIRAACDLNLQHLLAAGMLQDNHS